MLLHDSTSACAPVLHSRSSGRTNSLWSFTATTTSVLCLPSTSAVVIAGIVLSTVQVFVPRPKEMSKSSFAIKPLSCSAGQASSSAISPSASMSSIIDASSELSISPSCCVSMATAPSICAAIELIPAFPSPSELGSLLPFFVEPVAVFI